MAETNKYEQFFEDVKEDTSAPWWNDLPLEEKQAALERRIDPERPESPFYKEPWNADAVRPLLFEQFGALPPETVPFRETTAGRALGYAITPFEIAEQPLKNIRETLASPRYPGAAGDYVLDKTGLPTLAAGVKTVLDLPTEVPMMIAEGAATPAGLATAVVPGMPGFVRGAQRILRPAKPAVQPTHAAPPGYVRLDPGMELSGGVLPPLEAGARYTPPQGFLDKLASEGKELVRGPSGGLSVVPRGTITPVAEGRDIGMRQIKAGRVLDGRDYKVPEITVTAPDGTSFPVNAPPATVARLSIMAQQFAAAQGKPISTPGITPKDIIGKEPQFIEASDTSFFSTNLPEAQGSAGINWAAPTPADVTKMAKKGGKPSSGAKFRQQLKARLAEGAPVADDIADYNAGLHSIVPPGAVATPSPQYPYAFFRLWKDGTTVIQQLGEPGAQAAARVTQMYSNHERLAMTYFSEFLDEIGAIFPKRGFWDLRRMNPFTDTNAIKMFNMTQKQADNLVDVLYTKGKIQPIDTQVARAVEAYTRATTKINEHPGIRGLKITNPATGERGLVGQPGMFYSQQPVSDDAIGGILNTRHEASYVRYKKAYDMKHVPLGEDALTKAKYKDILMKREEAIRKDPTLHQAYWAGVTSARTFHADEFGLPSVVLKETGYNTDPVSNLFNYLAKASLLAERTVAKPELDLLEKALGEQKYRLAFRETKNLASAEEKGALSLLRAEREQEITSPDFIGKYFDVVTGRGKAHLLENAQQQWLSKIKEFNSATLLQLAGISSLPQGTYALARAGFTSTGKGLASYLKGGWSLDKAVSQESGALYSHYIQEMTHPQSAFGRLTQLELRLSGFSGIDSVQRQVSAHIGRAYAHEQAAIIARSKTHTGVLSLGDEYSRAVAKLKELGLDTDKIIANKGRLAVEDELLAAQAFANKTMGRTNIGGIPTWLAGSNEYLKALTQFKTFLFANSAEMARAIRHAPDAVTGVGRALRFAAGAQVSGEVVNDMLYLFRHARPGDGVLPSPFEKPERDAKAWKKFIDSPLGARAIENFTTGIGTVWAGMFMAGLPDEAGMLKALAGPSVGTLVTAAEDVFKMAGGEYKHLRDSHLAEDLARRFQIPGVTSIIGELPEEVRKRRERRIASDRAFKLEQ